MNAAHLHLVLNHFPLIGMVFAVPLLAIGWRRDNETLKKAGLCAIVFAALFGVMTFLTGEPAENVVKNLPEISKNVIHEHEEAAEKAIWMIGATGLVALGALIAAVKRKTAPARTLGLVLLLTVVSIAALARTNNLGGEINHPEIRGTN